MLKRNPIAGAILGDIIGSRFQLLNYKKKTFDILTDDSVITDDTILTLAIAKAVLVAKDNWKLLEDKSIEYLKYFTRNNPGRDYGLSFLQWSNSGSNESYNSYGNGSAMRVSACGTLYKTLEDVEKCSYYVTKVTHDHDDALLAAQVTATIIYMGRNNSTKEEMLKYGSKYYNLSKSLDELRPDYKFETSSAYTMPAALQAFFEGTSFIDVVRNAISLGGVNVNTKVSHNIGAKMSHLLII